MHAVVGNSWVLSQAPIEVGWYASRGVSDSFGREEIAKALRKDLSSLGRIETSSTYFHGKALARIARLAIIAEEIGCGVDVLELAKDSLRDSITPWMDGSFDGNSFVYDCRWGGLISRNGSRDPGADFGLGIYNDHHYHMGYFCYAGAVLAKLDSAWGDAYRHHLYTIAEDFMTLSHPHHCISFSSNDDDDDGDDALRSRQQTQDPSPFPRSVARSKPLFPKLRNFDSWVLHSWAGGLTEFADGRNQESSSEAINAYYSASLLGRAFGDGLLASAALTLTAFEIRSAQRIWHAPSSSRLYESSFVAMNRMLGVVWANKRDAGLWFASSDRRDCRVGIQVLPLLPVTEFLFCDPEFARELVEWAMPSLQMISRPGATVEDDGWKGLVYALQALYDPEAALHNVLALRVHDDGNSLSNMLWWIFSR
jgi:endoglucanase Acf2